MFLSNIPLTNSIENMQLYKYHPSEMLITDSGVGRLESDSQLYHSNTMYLPWASYFFLSLSSFL